MVGCREMKVRSQTSTLLTLGERPVGLWLLSSFTAILGLFIFIAFESPFDWLGFGCIQGANLMMFGSPVRTCSFDKTIARITFQQKGWLGKRVKIYPLETLINVQVETSNWVGLRFYRLCLLLEPKERFYLTPIPSTDLKLVQNLANSIQQFLKR